MGRALPGAARLQDQMAGALLAFARTGSPNGPGLPRWPATTPQDDVTMLYGPNSRAVQNHDRAFVQAFAPVAEEFGRRMREGGTVQTQH